MIPYPWSGWSANAMRIWKTAGAIGRSGSKGLGMTRATISEYGYICKAILAEVVAATTLLSACGPTLAGVRLQPEVLTTFHVGDIVAIHVPSARHYSIGSGGTALTLIKRTEQEDTTVYLYRAVETGRQTFVATPREPGPGGCVSCVTVHYFVSVIE
jgi:hypothetical protein